MRVTKLNTLVLGLEHFIDKIGYQAEQYKKNDISVKYLVNDKSQTSQYYAAKYDADVVVQPKNKILSVVSCFLYIFRCRPKFVELYDTGNMFFIYLILCFILRRKVLVVYRGGELQRHNGAKFNFNYIKHLFASIVAFRVIAKEKNILEEYKLNGFSQGKIRSLHNCVPTEFTENHDSKRPIDLLFLNSIRKQRNVPFLISVIARLREKKPGIKAVIAGFNSLDNENASFDLNEEKYILNLIDENRLNDVVEVFGFVKNPINFHHSSKLFLFPADIVFANYSLLESMSCGCVPIVADGEGAEIIVTNEEGSVLALDVDKWVNAIIELLDNETLRQQKSIASRNKIQADFSMDAWFRNMMLIRQE